MSEFFARRVPLGEVRRTYGIERSAFIAYFHFVGWDCLSLGAHICLSAPNVELHVPFGFFRVGRAEKKARDWLRECGG